MRLASRPMRIRPRPAWRTGRRSEAPWRPIALCWRLRRHRRPAPAMTSATFLRPPGPSSWSAQVHLNFSLADRHRPVPPRLIDAAVPAGPTRLFRNERFVTHLTRTVIEMRRERRIPRRPEREVRVHEQATRELLLLTLAPPVKRVSPAGSRPRSHTVATGSIFSPWPRRAAKPSLTDRAVPHRPRQVRPIALDFRAGRPSAVFTPRPTAAIRSASVTVRSVRPADLVWRAQAEGQSVEPGRSFTIGSAAAPPSAVAVAVGPGRTTPLAAMGRPPPPDSTWVDRLAEDVIGRVERRIRIERERRGVWAP